MKWIVVTNASLLFLGCSWWLLKELMNSNTDFGVPLALMLTVNLGLLTYFAVKRMK